MANLKLVDAFTDFVEESTLPYRQMMTYYNCALMEVETKFKVLNEQFSLFYDRNPIESIHTRIKSQSSILKKLQKKNLPLTISNIENNLFDIAGVRVVCSFTEDIYSLANSFLSQDDIRLIENLLIYNRVVDKMKVVYPFYESVIIKKPKKVNV